MQIIGFHGLKRSGKDTAAGALTSLGWGSMAFADALRKALYTLDPLLASGLRLHHVVDAYGWEVAKSGPYKDEIRRLMQALGTEVGRELLGEDIWVTKVADRIDAALEDERRGTGVAGIAVTDVRFDDEAEMVRAKGGLIVHIVRPWLQATDDHKSEKGISPHLIDTTVVNSGTVEELHRRVLDLVTVEQLRLVS